LDAIASRSGRNMPTGSATSDTKSKHSAIATGCQYAEWTYKSDLMPKRCLPGFSDKRRIYNKFKWHYVRGAHLAGGARHCRFSMSSIYRWNLRFPFQAGRSDNHKSPGPGARRRGYWTMSVGLSSKAIALVAALSTSPALSQTKPSPLVPCSRRRDLRDRRHLDRGRKTLSALRRAIVLARNVIHQRKRRETRLRRGQLGDAGQSRPRSATDVLRRRQRRLRPDGSGFLLRHDGARQQQGFARRPRNGPHFHRICVRVRNAGRKPDVRALSHRGATGEKHEVRAMGVSRYADPNAIILENYKSRKPAGPAPAAASSAPAKKPQ